MDKKGTLSFVLMVFVVVLAGLSMYLISKNKPTSNKTPLPPPKVNDVHPAEPKTPDTIATSTKAEVNTNGYKSTYEYKTDANGMVKGQKLVFLSPEGVTSSVPGLMALQIDLATRVHANGLYENTGEDITSFDMPISPFNKNIIFLSTSEPLEAPKEGLLNNNIIVNRIYTYNLQTLELTELYKKEIRNFAPEGAVMWRIVGIEENKLIILYDHMGNSPGPCWRLWYDGKDDLVSLDIQNLNAGLQSYNVDPEKIEADRIDSEKCVVEL